MADTNSAIHQYRMRSNLQPDIKHIPKTLLGALKESDLPMTDDELASVSLRVSDRNLGKKGGSKQPKPLHTKPAPSEKNFAASNALANAFTNSNPLDQEVQQRGDDDDGAPAKKQSTPSYTWVIILSVVLVLMALAGFGIYYFY